MGELSAVAVVIDVPGRWRAAFRALTGSKAILLSSIGFGRVPFGCNRQSRQGNRMNDGSACTKEKLPKWTETGGGSTFFCRIAIRINGIRSFFGAPKRTLGVL